MKELDLTDFDWDFSDDDQAVLTKGNIILNISKEELKEFIESWEENND